MNYLAHAYLSFGNQDILTGNMISDFVKGKTKFDYPLPIQKGIYLHRQIDSFTDSHIITKQAASIFKPFAGPYASVFVDIVYDHFLARDEKQFPQEKDLNAFAQQTYTQLQANQLLLPEKFAQLLPYMSSQNWLYNYRNLQGIENSFGNIFRRAKYLEKTETVYQCFVDQHYALAQLYNQFFPQLLDFTQKQYILLINE
jgi:acyl carrier protein phosphodiesterase